MYILFNLAALFHVIGYLTAGWIIKKKYEKELTSYYADITYIKFLWIDKFLKLFSILSALIFLIYLGTALFFPPEVLIYADIICTPLFTYVLYLYVMMAAFNNHVAFTHSEFKDYTNRLVGFNEFTDKQKEENNKYGNAALDALKLEEINVRLIQLMRDEKPFLDKSLTIKKLSDIIDVSSHQLSQCINTVHAKSFNEFVNYYRVEEAKRLLENSTYDNLKIDAIGEMAGFNSRSSFFSFFKKHTNTTPLLFKSQLAKKVD